MAATAKPDILKQQLLKHSSSLPWLPPTMSELRVVLLGNSWSERNSLGNLLLGEDQFKEEPDTCVRVEGLLKEKAVVVINTIDLLLPDISDHKLRKYVEDCVRLSEPGPHVFLLVLQPEDFTEEQKLRLCSVLQIFSHRSFNQSLVLTSAPREETSAKSYTNQPALKDMIEQCRHRHMKLKNLELQDLLTHLGKIVKQSEDDEYDDGGLTMSPIRPALNLVLLGRAAEKTAVVEAMLGGTGLRPASSSSQCVHHQAEVCGRRVSLVELPALSGHAAMEESFRCVSLCDPEGVHAFILVLPVAPLTDDHKVELESVRNAFGSGVDAFTFVLFTEESDPTHPAVADFVGGNRDVQELSQRCGGRRFVLNLRDQQQIPQLMEELEQMTGKGSRGFTKDQFTRAQMEKVTRLTELQNVNRSLEPVRMVLVGRTGSGKASTINTIFGTKHFEPRIPPKPPTTSCQKVSGHVDGRVVAVVNTPPLFHPTLPDAAFEREIKNSVGLLPPGPHAFILVLQLGNITARESVDVIKKYFGRRSLNFLLVVFTRGDDLGDEAFDSYVTRCPAFVQRLIDDCGGRFQVFNNKDDTNTTQVQELLLKVDTITKENGGNCFTSDNTDTLERILKEKEEEVRSLKKKLEQQTAETKVREKQLKEKDSSFNKEREERRKDEEKRTRKLEEAVKHEWRRKLEAERQQKESADRKLEQCRKEMRRDREAWDKEKKDLWERRHQDLKQNLEEEKSSARQLQVEYQRKRRRWVCGLAALAALALVLMLLVHYFIIVSTQS